MDEGIKEDQEIRKLNKPGDKKPSRLQSKLNIL